MAVHLMRLLGNHLVSDATNPFFDWEDLEKKDGECRMKGNEAKMEARGCG